MVELASEAEPAQGLELEPVVEALLQAQCKVAKATVVSGALVAAREAKAVCAKASPWRLSR